MMSAYEERGWELQPVDSIPLPHRGANGYLNELVGELIDHPGTVYRVFHGDYKRVIARRASLQSAIARQHGKTGDSKLPQGFRIFQRKLDGDTGALFATYNGGGER